MRNLVGLACGCALMCVSAPSGAQSGPTFGPYNVEFPIGGDLFARDLPPGTVMDPQTGWTLRGWVQIGLGDGPALLGGVGKEGQAAYLVVAPDRLGF